MNFDIREDDLIATGVIDLLTFHLAEMHRVSPPGTVHALPVEHLRAADVTVYAAWDGGTLAGFGALREVEPGHGEIKSMRAAPGYRSRGAGRAILDHLIGEARRRGYTRLSLETGRTEDFRPAISLYEKNGFAFCEPFADYAKNDFSICMTRAL